LRVGAIQHRDVAQRERLIGGAAREQLGGHELRFIALVETAHEGDRLARASRGAQRLAAPARVGADDDVRHLEHLRRRAVVLFEAHHAGGGKILLEVEDVADVGAPPPVNALIVVADDEHVAVLSA